MNFKKQICLIFTGQDEELCCEWERKGMAQRERKRKGEETQTERKREEKNKGFVLSG